MPQRLNCVSRYSLLGPSIVGLGSRAKLALTCRHKPLVSGRTTLSNSHRAMTTIIEPTAKRQKTDQGPLIGTHNGHFHADESLAVYMLRLLPTYASSPLIRTRDPSLLATCHTVVDVGGQYDSQRNLYDHHQREFNTTFPGHSTKLSSAGLVYMHMGKAIISHITGLDAESNEVKQLYEKMYTDFIEAFDANDNGINAYDVPSLRANGFTKRFNDRGFSISSCVARFNHHIPDPTNPLSSALSSTQSDEGKSAEQLQAEEDARFAIASSFTGQQFMSELIDAWKSWLPARAIVSEHFDNRLSFDDKGRILVLPHRKEGLPWHDHLYKLEEEQGLAGTVLYVLFPENGEPNCKWRIRAVSESPEGFENRKSLPAAWRGVRDEQLSEVSGISGCIFVHASGFIGGNKTFEGALRMAKKALEIDSE